jgi:hypothetical protein
MVGFFGVCEYHCHARRFSGDDERTKIFPKALDFGFGGRLFLGFGLFARHVGRPIGPYRCCLS